MSFVFKMWDDSVSCGLGRALSILRGMFDLQVQGFNVRKSVSAPACAYDDGGADSVRDETR